MTVGDESTMREPEPDRLSKLYAALKPQSGLRWDIVEALGRSPNWFPVQEIRITGEI